MALRLPSKLLRWIGERFFGSFIRQVADGKYGLRARSVYWWLAGKKTVWSVVLGAGAFVALGLGLPPDLAEAGAIAAGFLALAGFLDKGVRAAGRPAWLTDSPIYRLAVEYAGTLATVLTSGLIWTAGSSCKALDLPGGLAIDCALQTRLLLGLALGLVYLGVLDGAMLARAPIPPFAKRKIDDLRPWGTLILAGLSLLMLSGCGSVAQLQLGGGAVAHPDEKVVEGYVCLGQLDAARLYLEAPAFAWLGPARERFLIDAQVAKLRGDCPCPTAASCSK